MYSGNKRLIQERNMRSFLGAGAAKSTLPGKGSGSFPERLWDANRRNIIGGDPAPVPGGSTSNDTALRGQSGGFATQRALAASCIAIRKAYTLLTARGLGQKNQS